MAPQPHLHGLATATVDLQPVGAAAGRRRDLRADRAGDADRDAHDRGHRARARRRRDRRGDPDRDRGAGAPARRAGGGRAPRRRAAGFWCSRPPRRPRAGAPSGSRSWPASAEDVRLLVPLRSRRIDRWLSAEDRARARRRAAARALGRSAGRGRAARQRLARRQRPGAGARGRASLLPGGRGDRAGRARTRRIELGEAGERLALPLDAARRASPAASPVRLALAARAPEPPRGRAGATR